MLEYVTKATKLLKEDEGLFVSRLSSALGLRFSKMDSRWPLGKLWTILNGKFILAGPSVGSEKQAELVQLFLG